VRWGGGGGLLVRIYAAAGGLKFKLLVHGTCQARRIAALGVVYHGGGESFLWVGGQSGLLL